jgi:hypothetical protein
MVDWNDICKNRSKAHHLNLQVGKCLFCGYVFNKSSLNNNPRKDKDFPHLHHWYDKEERKNIIRGNKIILCSECHAIAHNYKYGWMKRWKHD